MNVWVGGPAMTTEATSKRNLLWAGLAVLMVFSGLCTVFASIVTGLEAWQEHARKKWPEVTAHVVTCGMQRSSTGRRQRYYIRCRLRYPVEGEENMANLYSASAPSREVWQYPPDQIAPLEQWIDEHPKGTPILVRYDPANHGKIIPASTGMLVGGPRTKSNIRLLEVFAGAFVILLMVVRLARPQAVQG